jgi:hypothetical protein
MTRLARALNSSDLAHEEFDCDVDVLQSAGLTAISRNLGVLIVEAKEGAAGEGSHAVARIKDLERGLASRITRMAHRWKVRVDVHGVAVKIAKELILDRCPVCQGRGLIPMKYDGQRMVAVSEDVEGSTQDVECHVCLGSGAAKRDYHSRAKCAGLPEYTKRLSEWWEAVLQSCADAELSARQAMWRRLKGEH